MAVATKAIELRVESVRTAAELGGRAARPGYEFVIVSTSWKNIIPLTAVDKKARNPQGVGGLGGFGNNRRPSTDPADVTMEPTPYVVPGLSRHIWLLSDERYADPVAVDSLNALPDHLSADGFTVAKLDEVVRGSVVFEVPAGASYRAFQFFDVDHGHALIPLAGAKPAPRPYVGAVQRNELLEIGLSEAGFGPAGVDAPPGLRHYTVGVRGASRSPKDIIELPLGQSVFLQNDQGCVSQPERRVAGLSRPFGDQASFLPSGPNEGQMTFLVPADTRQARLIIAPVRGTQIVLAASAGFAPSWPTPRHTIDDGTTMKVHILPAPQRPTSLPAPAAGREHVLLDVVVENLKSNQGIEFQGMQQLRLAAPDGGFVQPLPASAQLPCRLDDPGVIPAANARRFILVYDVPAGIPHRLQYRGFEKNEAFVDLKRP